MPVIIGMPVADADDTEFFSFSYKFGVVMVWRMLEAGDARCIELNVEIGGIEIIPGYFHGLWHGSVGWAVDAVWGGMGVGRREIGAE